MIAEVKRQPRSNRRTPPLDKPRDKPEFHILLFPMKRDILSLLYLFRTDFYSKVPSVLGGEFCFPVDHSGQSAKVSFVVTSENRKRIRDLIICRCFSVKALVK